MNMPNLEEYVKTHSDELRKQHDDYQKNCIWFLRNKDKLRKGFDGQGVAIYQERIIDSDKDISLLSERLERKYPQEHKKVYVGFVTKKKYRVVLMND